MTPNKSGENQQPTWVSPILRAAQTEQKFSSPAALNLKRATEQAQAANTLSQVANQTAERSIAGTGQVGGNLELTINASSRVDQAKKDLKAAQADSLAAKSSSSTKSI